MPKHNCMGHPWWQGKVRGCGYRVTFAREVILKVLGETQDHLSAEDIYNRINERHPNIGLTTVYRTLDVLSGLGLIHKLDFGDKRARYELAEDPKGARHHHHLVCTGCHTVIDYTDFIDDELKLLKNTEDGLAKKYDFRITNHMIQFYGLCANCRSER